jgi:hypothetical protein
MTDFPTQQSGFDLRSSGICGGQSRTGVRFLRVLRLALLIRSYIIWVLAASINDKEIN